MSLLRKFPHARTNSYVDLDLSYYVECYPAVIFKIQVKSLCREKEEKIQESHTSTAGSMETYQMSLMTL